MLFLSLIPRFRAVLRIETWRRKRVHVFFKEIINFKCALQLGSLTHKRFLLFCKEANVNTEELHFLAWCSTCNGWYSYAVNMYMFFFFYRKLTPGGGEKLAIFLWRHSSALKRRESYVNQAVAKNDVNKSFVFVEISFSHLLLHV